ncbi:alpha/beta hydrolase [Pseudoxanthomonas sp. Soil82]|uniref:alpha/beta hydrolase n=1 Tax=Pseudoxanthomonas sp. Soil82 TaxID=3157341 RepID=UPI00338DA35F
MRRMQGWIALLAMLAITPLRAADSCPDTTERFGEARRIVADLGRIVAPNGVQEAWAQDAGGIRQWVTARGQDRANPVILFVHGGPAAPLTPTLWQFSRPLEEYFTVVTYDQRAAGKTFLLNPQAAVADTLQVERYVDDAIAIAEAVRQRYHKRKLVLMGHSWGTIVGMRAALKRPDLFHAYVGIGQVIDVRENEQVSYDYAVAQARAHGNAEAERELAAIAPYPGDQPLTRERIVAARKWAQHYGGLSAYRDQSYYYFSGPKLSPEYGDAERCAIDAANVFTLGRVLDEFLQVSFKDVRRFPIPVVMFMGRHDYTTPSEPTARWLAQVQAPSKQAVWFEHASHMVPWEEPGKTLVSLLQHVRPLAEDDDED